MITQNTPFREALSWLDYLAEATNDPEKLLEQLNLPKERFKQDIAARRLFPLRVPQPFIEKMEKGNPHDPLFLQVMSSQQEFFQTAGFSRDPLQEQQSAVPNILHKYHNRVLLMVKGGCAINCRYCFRRHYPYTRSTASRSRLSAALAYLKEATDIREVILSGGDPLMLPDHHLQELGAALEAIPHLRRLRIHTRLPVVLPDRLTPELTDWLTAIRLQPVMVLHANHSRELSHRHRPALATLGERGVTLLNQSVLLAGINDNVQTLCDLSEKLFSVGVLPYYLHQLDRVAGAVHFEVTDQVALELHRQMSARLPGYLIPRLVRELVGAPSKTPLH